MTDFKKKIFLFYTIIIQTALAMVIGFLILNITTKNIIPPEVYIGDVSVGKLEKKQALEKVRTYYESIISKNPPVIKLDDKPEFSIEYSVLDTSIDYEATINLAYNNKKAVSVINLIDGYMLSKKKVVFPVIKINEDKLKEKLNQMAYLIDREPKNAVLIAEGGKISKVSHKDGLKLNIKNTIDRIKWEMSRHTGVPIVLNNTDGVEIQILQPDIKSEDLKDINSILASFSTSITNTENESEAVKACKAIDNTIVASVKQVSSKEKSMFSFNSCLLKAGIEPKTLRKDGASQVASTIFAAILAAGMDSKNIFRTAHPLPADYINLGLDVWLDEGNSDFTFQNTLNDNIAIICNSNKNGKIEVVVAGNAKDGQKKYSLKSYVESVFEPGVVYEETNSLKMGESKVISPGQKGFKVNIYRMHETGGIPATQYLFSTKYNAVQAIVQIGPNTQWDGRLSKK